MADLRGFMSAGERDRLVTIQQVADSDGASGFPVETWTTLALAWMGRVPIRGVERVQAGQIQARYDARWVMSYRADMDPDEVDVPKTRRLVYEGRSHDIVHAEHIGRKQGIELTTMASTKVS